MINYSISSRYAKVLFDLDCPNGNFEQRLEDFTFLLQLFHDYPRLVRFLKAPQVVFRDKEKVLNELFKEKFDPLFINYLLRLIQKGRLVNFDFIAKEYRRMVNEKLGRWEADVVTAISIDSESEEILKQKLEKDFNKKISLKNQVDPKIVGGVILVIENEMIDWSVTGRLRKIKENLGLQ